MDMAQRRFDDGKQGLVRARTPEHIGCKKKKLYTEILWACAALRLLKKQLFRNTFVSATRPPAHAVTIQLKNLCHQLLLYSAVERIQNRCFFGARPKKNCLKMLAWK